MNSMNAHKKRVKKSRIHKRNWRWMRLQIANINLRFGEYNVNASIQTKNFCCSLLFSIGFFYSFIFFIVSFVFLLFISIFIAFLLKHFWMFDNLFVYFGFVHLFFAWFIRWYSDDGECSFHNFFLLNANKLLINWWKCVFLFWQVSESEGASLAASHGIGFCEVSVADNTPELYKAFERLLNDAKGPVNKRKFSVTKIIGKLFEYRHRAQNSYSFFVSISSLNLIDCLYCGIWKKKRKFYVSIDIFRLAKIIKWFRFRLLERECERRRENNENAKEVGKKYF